MKFAALVLAVSALCVIALADDAPEVLLPCAFRCTARVSVYSADNELLGTAIDEIIRDNGDFWSWKSQFTGNEFVQYFLPDHEWSMVWRPDLGKSFRHDIMKQKCEVRTDIPPPYKWAENKTYGIVWFDELLEYEGKEATLFTAVAAGNRAKIDFEAVANFYVINEDRTIVHMNGTITGAHREIDLRFEATSLSFEHNKAVDPKIFVVSAPCPLNPAPAEPSDTFKNKCYKENGASMMTVSWLALLMVIIAAFLKF